MVVEFDSCRLNGYPIEWIVGYGNYSGSDGGGEAGDCGGGAVVMG